MKKTEEKGLKLRKIRILNYKRLEDLELEFPPPTMAGDLDVVVMGSRNGLGKTSVLECCALALSGVHMLPGGISLENVAIFMPANTNMIIRAGAPSANIRSEMIVEEKMIKGTDSTKYNEVFLRKADSFECNARNFEPIEDFFSILSGNNPNPLLSDFFIYLHSNRKIQPGNLDLGFLIKEKSPGGADYSTGFKQTQSTFKMKILRSMMSLAKLFEEVEDEQPEEILEKLNELVKRYAGGTVEKLRPSPDNSVEFRFKPVGGGPSFTLDGLSSGQKEIISTLFMIWYQTRKKPGVVLIDEPELHLNAEWRRDFIRQLKKIAPHNQYIIATHSKDVFASVEEDRRILLEEDAGGRS